MVGYKGMDERRFQDGAYIARITRGLKYVK